MSPKKEHMDKVRLARTDIDNGNVERANDRMNTGDGGLAKHNATCTSEINWEDADYRTREEDNTTEVSRRYHAIEGRKHGDNSPQLV